MDNGNGFIPRSIVRTIQRFFKEVTFDSSSAVYELVVSRYIAGASLQCFFFLIICPWAFQFFMKFFMHFFDFNLSGIFLNFHQQEQAFAQIQKVSQQIYFETLFESKAIDLGALHQTYFFKCASFYNQQTISIITNWILDFTTLIFFLFLLIYSTPQILIFKTFCIESLLSLSETTKCFFLIFFLDLLVGFHSSKSWSIFLQFFIEHLGIEKSPNFIAFFISTFPVLLDTIFKYWIFRYLNKISPSTVATYQAMIE